MAVLATLLAVFYAEENWRGRRAWEQCKRDLKARGESVDWSACIPAPIPDEENIIKAPKMAEWFVKPFGDSDRGSELRAKLDRTTLPEFAFRRHPHAIEVTIVPWGATNRAPEADLVVRYRHGVVAAVSWNGVRLPTSQSTSNLSRIAIEDQPLSDALQVLARFNGLNYVIDPAVLTSWKSAKGRSAEPNVSVVWENITGIEGLILLLNNWNLRWVEDPKTGIARVVKRQPRDPRIYVETGVRAPLQRLLESAFAHNGKPWPTLSVRGPQDLLFVAEWPEVSRPVRMMVLADEQLHVQDIEAMFPTSLAAAPPDTKFEWRAEPAGNVSFQVSMRPNSVCAATDYLAWSDQCAREVELIREALKRPNLRMDADYQRPFEIPVVNFINIRNLAQTAAQRAQCCLLLGRSEQAFLELSLIFELRRLLATKPALLVASMIDVAISGLCTETIADGFRLGAWREPELLALQQQLWRINLLQSVEESLRFERLAACHTLETTSARDMVRLLAYGRSDQSPWKQIINPVYLLLKLAPRGWVYLNLATLASLEQRSVDIFDVKNQIAQPRKARACTDAFQTMAEHWSPNNILVAIAAPNFVRASLTTARNQTRVNQALIVCGLERHRLAHGTYPESLDALVPQFLEKLPADVIGGQPLKYRRTDDGQFLLYSIGWNEKDDGGIPGKEADTGDWVWTMLK